MSKVALHGIHTGRGWPRAQAVTKEELSLCTSPLLQNCTWPRIAAASSHGQQLPSAYREFRRHQHLRCWQLPSLLANHSSTTPPSHSHHPLDGAWCLVCHLCRLAFVCVDWRCCLSFVFLRVSTIIIEAFSVEHHYATTTAPHRCLRSCSMIFQEFPVTATTTDVLHCTVLLHSLAATGLSV